MPNGRVRVPGCSRTSAISLVSGAGLCFLGRLSQPLGHALVVEIVRQPQSGIRPLELRTSRFAREKQRPGIYRRGQKILAVTRPLRVEKGQLGQRKQAILVTRWAQSTMQFGENRLRLLLEPVQESESPEHCLGRFRGLARREGAFGLEAIAGLQAQLCSRPRA